MFNAAVENMPIKFQDSMRLIYSDGGFTGPCSKLATAIWDNINMERILKLVALCSNVNSKYTKNQFSLLTLAAIQGNTPAMEALKEEGAELDAQDKMGYTPLHHLAMLGNEAGAKKLLDWNAPPDIQTNYGATYMDLFRFNAPFRNGTIPLNRKLFSAHTNDHNEFDKACIPSDVKLVDEMVATPSVLVGLYATAAYTADTKEELHPWLKKQHEAFLPFYAAFKKNPPVIAAQFLGNFCGLFAKQLIKTGEIIAEYTGKLTFDEWDPPYKEGAYVWGTFPSVDSGLFRSHAAMANDGFPNAAVMSLEDGKGLDGLENRKILFALENIEPSEEIRINYGTKNAIKKEPKYQELGYEGLQKYLNSHSWDGIYKSVHSVVSARVTPGTSEYFDAISVLEKARYILETPTVFLRLVKEKRIAQENMGQIRELNKLYDRMDPESKEFRDQVIELATNSFRQTTKNEL